MTKQQTNRLDAEFSKFIRSRGSCERCGTTRTLQTAHIYSRSYKSIRWSPLNALCLCAGCHFWWHKNPVEAVRWVGRYLGEAKINALAVLRRQTAKWISPEIVRASWNERPDREKTAATRKTTKP